MSLIKVYCPNRYRPLQALTPGEGVSAGQEGVGSSAPGGGEEGKARARLSWCQATRTRVSWCQATRARLSSCCRGSGSLHWCSLTGDHDKKDRASFPLLTEKIVLPFLVILVSFVYIGVSFSFYHSTPLPPAHICME